jgi:hypothetical protein
MAYTTIDLPTEYFNTTAYTGDGVVGRNLTTGIFQPDWVWIKSRSDADNHRLVDAVRGATKHLESDNTSAEQTSSNVTAFTPTGITLSSNGAVNANTETYVAWAWLGANSTASNTAGSITSTVSANTTSGFSIVSYTGTGANATVGHGLGSTPKFIAVKKRSATSNWGVQHANYSILTGLAFNSTAVDVGGTTWWNSTLPTSSVFSVGTDTVTNASSATFIAYCFADVKGFSKFGSYTGDGSSDGPFIYTGFKPAFVMAKASSTTSNWTIYDNMRPAYNQSRNPLYANTSDAEQVSGLAFDILSNGFKWREGGGQGNDSGVTFIYMAFAENPFVTSTSIPTTAR